MTECEDSGAATGGAEEQPHGTARGGHLWWLKMMVAAGAIPALLLAFYGGALAYRRWRESQEPPEKKMLEHVEAFYKANPAAFDETIEKLGQVDLSGNGNEWSQVARRRIAEVEKDRCRMLYTQAEAFWRRNPGNPKEAIRRFQAVLRPGFGTVWRLKAEDMIGQIEAAGKSPQAPATGGSGP